MCDFNILIAIKKASSAKELRCHSRNVTPLQPKCSGAMRRTIPGCSFFLLKFEKQNQISSTHHDNIVTLESKKLS